MPFLRAAEKPREIHIKCDIPPFPEVISGIKPAEDEQLKIPYKKPESNDLDSETEKVTKTDQGRAYEKYVGSLYKKEGYIVIYNGIEKGNRDGGIDLICKKGSFTVLVQCKCYERGNVTLRDIYYLYGASRRYALHCTSEIVQSAFWTTMSVKRTSEIFRATIELGIRLYENAKITSKGQQR